MKNLASLPLNITAPSDSSPSSFSYEALVLLSRWRHFAAYYPTICSDQLLTCFHVESVLWRFLKSDNVNTTVAVLLH